MIIWKNSELVKNSFIICSHRKELKENFANSCNAVLFLIPFLKKMENVKYLTMKFK